MAETKVRLYMCDDCHRQVFEKDMDKGKACKCGSGRVKYLQPITKLEICRYFLHNPKMLKVWWNENVLKRNS